MFNTYIKAKSNETVTEHYIGSCATYHGFAYQTFAEEMGLVGDVREREFERVRQMKLKVARTWYRPDFSRDMFKRFCLWLDEMKKQNVDVMLSASWFFTKDVWFFSHENHSDPDYTSKLENFDKCCEKMASWIAKSLESFIVVRGYTNIKYLSLFTEPFSYASGPCPEGIDYFEAYERCCRKINEKLIKFEVRDKVKLVGPNGIFTSHDDNQLQRAIEKMDDIIDIYSMHTYAWCDPSWQKNRGFYMTGYEGWKSHAEYVRKIAEKTGKPVWFDEYGLSGDGRLAEGVRDSVWYGNYIALINAALINGGMNNTLIWTLFDQKYPYNITNNDSFYNGVQRWGCCKMPGDSIKDSENARPSWYVISLLSRYMSDGDAKVVKCEFGEGICAAVTVTKDGRTSVLAVNMRDDSANVTIDVEASGLKRYLYDPAALKPAPDYIMIEPDKKLDTAPINDILPPYSVAVYSNAD